MMTKITKTLAAATVMMLLAVVNAVAGDYVPKDYVWTTQSRNASESMPCGGHDVGMNVWVENGDVLFYVSKSGWFDENNTLLKAGRFRLRLTPDPFCGTDSGFTQTLRLADGAVYIKGRGTSIRLWVDVKASVVFMEVNSKTKVDARLSYENWRYRDREVTKAECQQCSYKWNLPKGTVTKADVVTAHGNSLSFRHKNSDRTVFDFTVEKEKLDSIKSQLNDPIGGMEYGGDMLAPGFSFTGTSNGQYASTDFKAWNFEAKGIKSSTVRISLFAGEEDAEIPAATQSKKRSAQWWHDFWQRSYITVDSHNARSKVLTTMVRNYELARYMFGCNAYGAWPTKFNGGLFTFDPVYVDVKAPFTPDFRRWGGGTMTAQNQRLVYWPMLKSGDTDMMAAQFNTYLYMLPAAVARTRHYWGHDGASFCEQLENFGLPNPAEYGKHRPGDDYGTERNAWLEYQWDTSLEFCSMMLLSNSYAGTDINRYEEMIRQCLTFFDQHYQYLARQRGVKALDGDGKLILYPSSGCETYKMAYNPSSVIAALKTVTAQAEAYSAKKLSLVKTATPADSSLLKLCRDMQKRIPDIPLRTIGGDTCIAPAIVWARIQNVETPQLYPVFPWRIYGMGRDGIEIARNTYLKDLHALEMRTSKGWKQDNIWAACLGLTDEAERLNTEKLGNGPYRFTAFYDPGFDWAPDLNRAGAGMIGVQEMLLQERPDGQLLLFPAWPKDVDASFKLHATGGRTVVAKIRGGKVEIKNWGIKN